MLCCKHSAPSDHTTWTSLQSLSRLCSRLQQTGWTNMTDAAAADTAPPSPTWWSASTSWLLLTSPAVHVSTRGQGATSVGPGAGTPTEGHLVFTNQASKADTRAVCVALYTCTRLHVDRCSPSVSTQQGACPSPPHATQTYTAQPLGTNCQQQSNRW